MYFFKIPHNLIASAFFLRKLILKNIDMPRRKAPVLHWQNLLTESIKIMRLIERCFSESDKHGQTSNVI